MYQNYSIDQCFRLSGNQLSMLSLIFWWMYLTKGSRISPSVLSLKVRWKLIGHIWNKNLYLMKFGCIHNVWAPHNIRRIDNMSDAGSVVHLHATEFWHVLKVSILQVSNIDLYYAPQCRTVSVYLWYWINQSINSTDFTCHLRHRCRLHTVILTPTAKSPERATPQVPSPFSWTE